MPQIERIEVQRFADVCEREKIGLIVVENPFLRVKVKCFFSLTGRAEVILETDDRVFQDRKHEDSLWLQMKPSLLRGLVLE